MIKQYKKILNKLTQEETVYYTDNRERIETIILKLIETKEKDTTKITKEELKNVQNEYDKLCIDIRKILKYSSNWVHKIEFRVNSSEYHKFKLNIFNNESRLIELILAIITNILGVAFIKIEGGNAIEEVIFGKKRYIDEHNNKEIYITKYSSKKELGSFDEYIESINYAIDNGISEMLMIYYVGIRKGVISKRDIIWTISQHIGEIELKNSKIITIENVKKEIVKGFEIRGTKIRDLSKDEINIIKVGKINKK